MESAGSAPSGAVRPDDLVDVVRRRGPFATLSLARSGSGAWGERADDVGAAQGLDALRDAGAPAEVVDRFAEAFTAVSAGARGVVAVADEREVLVEEELDDEPRAAVSRWEPLPSLAEVIEHRQSDIAVMVVLADRIGADVHWHRSGRGERQLNVEGDDHPITKSQPGGWSQRRYQQRAADTWEHNANQVAEMLRTTASDDVPELIVLGGDERAVELISERLPAELRAVTHTVTYGRAADSSEDHRNEAVARLVRTARAEQTVALLHALAEHQGGDARAANGPADTLAALAQAQVDVLLVHDDSSDDRRAWFSRELTTVAIDRASLDAMGGTDAESARLVDVAIYGALITGASIRVVPRAQAIDGGMAAILRWPAATVEERATEERT